MTSAPTLVPEAKADVSDAYLWYEEQSLGLGMDFLRCVEAALLSIQRMPLIYQVVHETYRRAFVRRFPFAIYFEVDDSVSANPSGYLADQDERIEGTTTANNGAVRYLAPAAGARRHTLVVLREDDQGDGRRDLPCIITLRAIH